MDDGTTVHNQDETQHSLPENNPETDLKSEQPLISDNDDLPSKRESKPEEQNQEEVVATSQATESIPEGIILRIK